MNLVLADGKEEMIDRTKQPSPLEFEFLPGWKEPQYETAKSWPSPRVFMNHLPEHMMPKQIYEGKGKV